MTILSQVLGKYVNMDEVMHEAMSIAGQNPSFELIITIAVRKMGDNLTAQIEELKKGMFVNAPTLQELEDQGKLPPPPNLASYRHLKDAGENLGEIMDLMDDARKKAANDDRTITLGEEMDSKDIYLRRPISDKLNTTYEIVGLHAIGHAGPYEYTVQELDGSRRTATTNFMALDVWGNEYDDQHNMLGRGSFRLHTSDIEDYAKQMEADGWFRYEGPKRKK